MAISPRAHEVLARPRSSSFRQLVVSVALVASIMLAAPQLLAHQPATPTKLATVPELPPLVSPNDSGAPSTFSITTLTALFDLFATLGGVSEAAESISATAQDRTVSEVSSLSATSGLEAANQEPAALIQEASAAPSAPQAASETTVVNPVERWAQSGIYIETENQQLDEYSLAAVDTALGAIPPAMLGQLGNPALGPMHILVNTEGRTMSGNQPYRGPANFFSTNEATNELVLYPQQSVFTIVHELGHAFNLRRVDAGRYAMALLDPEMRSFLDATGWTIQSPDEEIRTAIDHMHVRYTYTGNFSWTRVSNEDPLEDFANSFAMYLLDPEGLASMSPERYDWMALHLGQYQ